MCFSVSAKYDTWRHWLICEALMWCTDSYVRPWCNALTHMWGLHVMRHVRAWCDATWPLTCDPRPIYMWPMTYLHVETRLIHICDTHTYICGTSHIWRSHAMIWMIHMSTHDMTLNESCRVPVETWLIPMCNSMICQIMAWLIHMCHVHMCDVTHDYVWVMSRTCRNVTHTYVGLIHMCSSLICQIMACTRDMTHSCVWRDSFTWVMTHPYVWIIRVSNYGMTHPYVSRPYVWRDSFTCVTWLIHMCDVTHSHVWRDSFTW
jgi:hypothetical protein